MQLLLDTHTLIWWLANSPALSKQARTAIESTSHTIFVSAASAWEIATKFRLGKLNQVAELATDFASHMDREGFKELPIAMDHAVRAGLLAGTHRDPFDRMLIAQAQAENLVLVSKPQY